MSHLRFKYLEYLKGGKLLENVENIMIIITLPSLISSWQTSVVCPSESLGIFGLNQALSYLAFRFSLA